MKNPFLPRIALLAVLLTIVALSMSIFMSPPADQGAAEGEGMVTFYGPLGPAFLSVELADIPQEHITGLMGREFLPGGEGMLFIFGEDAGRSFWMKNTLIPLDMIFINSSLDIVSIHRDVPPCTGDPCPTYKSGLPAMYVVEANAGFAGDNGISPGGKVAIDLS